VADFPYISVGSDKTSDKDLFKQVRSRPQIRTPFSGPVQSRTKGSSSRWKFQVGGHLISSYMLNILIAFFDTNQGSTFDFVHPITGSAHVVRFSDDELPEAVPVGDGSNARWKMEGINLEETISSTIRCKRQLQVIRATKGQRQQHQKRNK